ncbi:MAG: hypothetical protein ACR2QM_10975 [Longimicrobiales bacterium]
MIERQVDPINIDVSSLVQQSVASLYSNLVTRPTGRAVRQAIEQQLGGGDQVSVSLIDFTEVRILDFSCADEVVAKLVMRYLDPSRPRNAYFLFRAVGELHAHAVEEVLIRQGLAAVCDLGGGSFELFGSATPPEVAAWKEVETHRYLGPDRAQAPAVSSLVARRLLFRDAEGAVSALSSLSRQP